MAYIGTPAVDRFTASKAASVYSGDGSTTAFTLEHAVGSDEDILVSVDGVVQEPSVAYAVSTGTTLTFTAAPSSNSGNNIFVYYLFSTLGTVTHPATSALSATSGTFTGAITGGGLLTTGGNIVIPNAGNIGSASDVDAMAISSGGIVTFSQAPVGAGMDLLYSLTSSSGVSAHDISSTYINSTYDNYYLVGYFEGDGDTKYLQARVFVGGTLQTGTIYGYGSANIDGEGYQNANAEDHLFTATASGMGGDDGEGTHVSIVFQNANNTQAPFSCTGSSTLHNTSAAHGGTVFGGSLKPANRANVVNGLRLKMHSGNTTYAKFKLYGLRD